MLLQRLYSKHPKTRQAAAKRLVQAVAGGSGLLEDASIEGATSSCIAGSMCWGRASRANSMMPMPSYIPHGFETSRCHMLTLNASCPALQDFMLLVACWVTGGLLCGALSCQGCAEDPFRGLLDGQGMSHIAAASDSTDAAARSTVSVTDVRNLMACVCNAALHQDIRCQGAQQLISLVQQAECLSAMAVPSFLEACLCLVERAVGIVHGLDADAQAVDEEVKPLSVFQMQLPMACMLLLSAMAASSRGVLVRFVRDCAHVHEMWLICRALPKPASHSMQHLHIKLRSCGTDHTNRLLLATRAGDSSI